MCNSKKYCAALVVALYDGFELSHKEICEQTGYPSSAVGNIISRRIGTKKERGHVVRARWTVAETGKAKTGKPIIEEIEREYLDGASSYELGEKYGVYHATVSKWMRSRGHQRVKGASAPHSVVCARCGKRFIATKKNQLYCSPTCLRAIKCQRRNDSKRVNGNADLITLREVWERDGGRCYLCGVQTDWNDYHIVNGWWVAGPRYPTRDHVIAIHNGGTHTWDNVRLACFGCNSKKGDKGQLRLAI